MHFDHPLFIVPLITGSTFLVTGWILRKYPPKEINRLYGYRTGSSMKNQERWDFAQHYSAIELIRMGVILLLLAIAGVFLPIKAIIGLLVSMAVLFTLIILLILRTEKAIKKQFDKHHPD